MNRRLQDLKKQATEASFGSDPNAPGGTNIQLNPELFADLIIKDCLDAIDPAGKGVSMSEEVWRERCMELIKKNFGM